MLRKVKAQIEHRTTYSVPCISGGDKEKIVNANRTTYRDPHTNGCNTDVFFILQKITVV